MLWLTSRRETESIGSQKADFPPTEVFCMVGTNRMDYEVALGLSRTFAGHGSDGLVRIENATLCGLKDNGQPGQSCAKAFAYRSHSGYFGIVNSEEAYQNLARFLFGNVRVDSGWMSQTSACQPKFKNSRTRERRSMLCTSSKYLPPPGVNSGISQDVLPKKTP